MNAAGTGEARSSTRTERTVLLTGVVGLIRLPALWSAQLDWGARNWNEHAKAVNERINEGYHEPERA